MVAGFVLVWFGARREHLESLEPVGPVTGTGDGGAPGDGGAGDGGAGADGGRQAEPVGARAGRTGRPAKPKKVRIWDEEDG